MSTAIMAQCWPLQMPPTPKGVLISLADNANDEGYCWPSLATIAMRTCFSERAVRNAISWLEENNALKANRSNGRHTTYIITPGEFKPQQDMPGLVDANPGTTCTPAPAAPRHEMPPTPAGDAGDPGTTCRTPRHQVPTNRHRTVNEPSLNRQPAQTKPRKPKPTSLEGFDAFWQSYPRKVSRAKAEQAWQKLEPDDELQTEILQAIERAKTSASWCKDGGEYIPYPATWLNGKRWLDAIAPELPLTGGGDVRFKGAK